AYSDLGKLIAIDGSLIDGVLSMDWAQYRKGSKKAKAHVGFSINNGTPYKAFITDGNGAERPFVNQILEKGQTSVTDRGYQCHKTFDLIQEEGKSFICRIRENTTKTVMQQNSIPDDSIVFFDSVVILGRETSVQTQKDVRLIAYTIDDTDFWIATNRFDLTAEQIAQAYKLRWEIETFFAWWKRHLSVYHILARSEYGLKVQIFAGLITYLLLAIYCHQEHGEKVSIKRVRELRYQIINESRETELTEIKKRVTKKSKAKKKRKRSAKT
ncbi:MAG: IS4 family transposase, partial [Bacteroidetes bacterium]|nr:IS4 family transposase [Bacteroidota bacterium]